MLRHAGLALMVLGGCGDGTLGIDGPGTPDAALDVSDAALDVSDAALDVSDAALDVSDAALDADVLDAPDPLPEKLVVLWGQSNAHGLGDVDSVTIESGLGEEYPAVGATYHHAIGWANPIVWTTREPGPLRPYSAAGNFGVELSLMRRLNEAEPNAWNVVKVSVNGAYLGGWQGFDPLAANPVPNLFDQAVAFTMAAMAHYGVTADNVSFVWIQGEADAKNQMHSLNYAANLFSFMTELRDEIPGVAIYLNRLSAHLDFGAYPYRENVRTQQAAYLALDGDAVLVDDAGLTLLDGAHLDHDSLVTLGNRFAAAILADR